MKHNKTVTKNNLANAIFKSQSSNRAASKQDKDQLNFSVVEIDQNFRKSHGAQSSFMVTKKAKLYRKDNFINTEKSQTEKEKQRFSTFDRLKNEIKHLQNSQFLSLKDNAKIEVQKQNDSEFNDYALQYCVNKEFMSTKRASLLQRYKLVLKKRKRGRKMSNIIKYDQLGDSQDYSQCFASVKVVSGLDSISNRTDLPLKKKETPNIVKKYYRPLSSNIKNVDYFQLNQNQVRGRQLKSNSCSRKDKQNFIVMC